MNEITDIFEKGLALGLKEFSSEINWLFVICILVVSLVLIVTDRGKPLAKGNPRYIIMIVGTGLLIIFWIFGERDHTVITLVTDIFAIFTATLIYIIGKFIINIKSIKK